MATTFATDGQVTALVSGLADATPTTLGIARSSAYSLIVSALAKGGYDVETFTDSPASYGFLTLLETRCVALDLLGGGAASSIAGMAGDNFKHWKQWCERILEGLEHGELSILNDDTGEMVDAPARGRPGLITSERNPGVTLDSPTTWSDPDPITEW